MEHVHECDRRSASAAQAGVPASIVEKGAPIGCVAADHQPDEYRVIAAGNRVALLALDVRDDAVDHRDPALIFTVTHTKESIRLLAGEAPRQRLLLGGENVEDEMGAGLECRVH